MPNIDRSALMVSTALVQWMASGLSRRGLNATALMRKAGGEGATWAREGGQIPLHAYSGLLHGLIRELGDEALCLLTRPSRRGAFELQARAAVSGATLEAAIRHVVQAFGVLHDDVRLVLDKSGTTTNVVLCFSNNEVQAIPHVHVHTLRAYSQLFAWLVGGRLPQLSFDFAFERPTEPDGLAPLFAGDLRFNASYSAIRFNVDGLQLPVCRDGNAMKAFIMDGPLYHRRESGAEPVSRRVREFLAQPSLLWPDLEATAKALRLSTSTLHRRLAEEGESFQVLKDQLRRDVAIQRLCGDDHSMAKLAHDLGFADGASFQRAFKQWTGLPPGAYRRLRR